MRVTVSLACLIAGVVLATVSYLALAAPLGLPRTEAYSNPRVPFAAGIFVIGIVLGVFSAVLYELLPERNNSER